MDRATSRVHMTGQDDLLPVPTGGRVASRDFGTSSLELEKLKPWVHDNERLLEDPPCACNLNHAFEFLPVSA